MVTFQWTFSDKGVILFRREAWRGGQCFFSAILSCTCMHVIKRDREREEEGDRERKFQNKGVRERVRGIKF